MSGHNKWSSIKYKKGAADAKRGKVFTKIIKEITVAARIGGGDPESNPRLRAAVDRAKAANMPADNMARAIKKGTGELEGVTYEEMTYEVYGPGGAALLIEVLTDNKNRTVAELKHLLSRHNGALGRPGTVAFKFERLGTITYSKEGVDEDAFMEAALEAGADDVRDEDEAWMVVCDPTNFMDVKDALEKVEGLPKPDEAALAMLPLATVKLTGRDAESMIKLYQKLDDHDDVQNVYADFDIDDSLWEQMAN
ncbi:MAG: YebC/PmpR family DNA-binding transcriptional regulator [Deltaproteobacteria bacterium]|nr:YebC/PmpR family DNA-binding transcriptional regulator [Deltaproteobacteria bacterium]